MKKQIAKSSKKIIIIFTLASSRILTVFIESSLDVMFHICWFIYPHKCHCFPILHRKTRGTEKAICLVSLRKEILKVRIQILHIAMLHYSLLCTTWIPENDSHEFPQLFSLCWVASAMWEKDRAQSRWSGLFLKERKVMIIGQKYFNKVNTAASAHKFPKVNKQKNC